MRDQNSVPHRIPSQSLLCQHSLLSKNTRHRRKAAITPTAPSPSPSPPTAFATAPPVPSGTLALAAAVVVAPLPKENAVSVDADVLVSSVVGIVVFVAACVSEAAAVEVVFHMWTLG